MEEYRKYEPIFGSWYLVRLLGKGSFGKVFEIAREEFGTTYRSALKIISVPQDDDDVKSRMSEGTDIATISEYYEGILREIINENEIMAQLKGNSNIVSYEDHQIIPHEDGIGYDILIRMELLTPLLDRMVEKKLDEEEVVKLGIDICKALEVCHRKNIIHRDIKPQNIFISENKDYKLGDFGIARTIEKTTGGMSKKGTYKYMAPEVFRGENYDSTVDIYSLGIVLYSLLNGNRGPFLPAPPAKVTHNDEEQARIRRFRGEPIPAPRDASPMLAYIIQKACAANPGMRYQTAEKMRKDLESYLVNYRDDEPTRPLIYDSTPAPGPVPTPTPGPAPTPTPGPVPMPTQGYAPAPTPSPGSTQKVWKWLAIALAGVLVITATVLITAKVLNKNDDTVAEEPPAAEPEVVEVIPDEPEEEEAVEREPENILPVGAMATSEREPIGELTYKAGHVADRNYDTAWVEGADGPGEGECITVFFDNKYPIEAICIANGYQKSDETYTGNYRVKDISIEFDDGSSYLATLLDRNGDQLVILPESKDAHSVTIRIRSTYKGDDKDKDTCITEIMLEELSRAGLYMDHIVYAY